MNRSLIRGNQGLRLKLFAVNCRLLFKISPLPFLPTRHKLSRWERSAFIFIDRSTTSVPRKKSGDTILMFCFHVVSNRWVIFLLTASAFSLNDPLRNNMSSTLGVVWAIAEYRGDWASEFGAVDIALSRYLNSSVGLFVLAHRCLTFGQSQPLSANKSNNNNYIPT